MNNMEWDHVILNRYKKVVFRGPMEACLSFYYAGSGGKYGWIIKKDIHHAF